MNNARRKRLEEASGKLDDAKAIIEEVKEEEQEVYDNLPEPFQQGEQGDQAQAAVEAMDEAYNSIEEAVSQTRNRERIGRSPMRRVNRRIEFGPRVDQFKSSRPSDQPVIVTWWEGVEFKHQHVGTVAYPFGVCPTRGVGGYDGLRYAVFTPANGQPVTSVTAVDHYRQIRATVRVAYPDLV